MKTRLPALFFFAFVLSSVPLHAQDVNNPTAQPTDRPQGPSSAPAIATPDAPMASGTPATADPNAPVVGRATEFPPVNPRASDRARSNAVPPADAVRRSPQSNGF